MALPDMHCSTHHCGLLLKPYDLVVVGELLDANREPPAGAVIVHERHWPPSRLRWRVTYRGPLRGIADRLRTSD